MRGLLNTLLITVYLAMPILTYAEQDTLDDFDYAPTPTNFSPDVSTEPTTRPPENVKPVEVAPKKIPQKANQEENALPPGTVKMNITGYKGKFTITGVSKKNLLPSSASTSSRPYLDPKKSLSGRTEIWVRLLMKRSMYLPLSPADACQEMMSKLKKNQTKDLTLNIAKAKLGIGGPFDTVSGTQSQLWNCGQQKLMISFDGNGNIYAGYGIMQYTVKN